MKVLDKRFLRGPNIHRMTPCFAVLLEQKAPGQPAADSAEVARLLAQSMIAIQALAGSPVTFCDAHSLAPQAPEKLRLLCGYTQEAVAEEALRIVVDDMTALLTQQPFDLESRVAVLRALVVASAADTAVQAPPPSARIPVIAVTGTNGKTTTTQLIAHVLRAGGAHTGMTTTQGIYIDGHCVQTGDCSGYWSARRVLADPAVQVAVLETARGGILKRGLAFDRCDVGVVLNVSNDHLGLDGVETLQDLAHVKGLVARCARDVVVLNADDAWCLAMRETLSPGCKPVLFTLDAGNTVFNEHLREGGAGACLDAQGWLVWCSSGERLQVVQASDLPFTWHGHARYNTANALAALAALRGIGHDAAAIAHALRHFMSDARSNPLRGNRFDVDGVKLIVDYAHNVAAYRALCDAARSMVEGGARLVGVVTSPGDRRPQDLHETGQVCGLGFDELVVYEQDPRGRAAGATSRDILQGARAAAPNKPLHCEPRIRQALWRGLCAARSGDVLVFTCAGSFADLVEGVRLKSPAAAERIALQVCAPAMPALQPTP